MPTEPPAEGDIAGALSAAANGFVFKGLPTRVVFGRGLRGRLGDEIDALGARRVLVLSTPGQKALAADVAAGLGDRLAGHFAGARTHTPVEVTAAAMAALAASGADATLAIGGGSTTGLGKAIALRTGLPQIVVPTTYAGSEMTEILGETEAGRKTTRRDPRVRPELVVYDVDLTLTLPPRVSATSGLNAIAHAVEGLYAPDRNPLATWMAREGLAALGAALPAIADDPADIAARTGALYGAWLCGATLGAVAMGLHHKLCHVLGGSFDLPHADTHAVLLPYVTAFNAVAAPDLLAPVAALLGGEAPGGALYDLNRRIDAPVALRDIGMTEAGLDRAADIAMENPYGNVRPFTRDDLRVLLDDAYRGRRPAR